MSEENTNVTTNVEETGTKTKEDGTVEKKGTETQVKTKETTVDVEKVKQGALSELFKSLGVEDDTKLKEIVQKAKDEEEKNKTDLQRKDTELQTALKELADERELRIVAEAKLSAIQLGARKELVDDLVIVAKSKVTKDKDINAVITEIKDSESGKVYFLSDEEQEENKEKGTVTRKRVNVQKKEKTKEGEGDGEGKHSGSMAERLLSGRKNKKTGHYFK